MKKMRWDLLGIFGGVTGLVLAIIAVIKTHDKNSLYIAAAMVIVFGGMGFALYKLLWKQKFNMRRLLLEGIPASATILEVHETNITVNNNPQYRLVIEINNGQGEAYTTSCKTIVSRRATFSYQKGKAVNIKIDPKDEKNVIIV